MAEEEKEQKVKPIGTPRVTIGKRTSELPDPVESSEEA